MLENRYRLLEAAGVLEDLAGEEGGRLAAAAFGKVGCAGGVEEDGDLLGVDAGDDACRAGPAEMRKGDDAIAAVDEESGGGRGGRATVASADESEAPGDDEALGARGSDRDHGGEGAGHAPHRAPGRARRRDPAIENRGETERRLIGPLGGGGKCAELHQLMAGNEVVGVAPRPPQFESCEPRPVGGGGNGRGEGLGDLGRLAPQEPPVLRADGGRVAVEEREPGVAERAESGRPPISRRRPAR